MIDSFGESLVDDLYGAVYFFSVFLSDLVGYGFIREHGESSTSR